jgi:hypothetical protein
MFRRAFAAGFARLCTLPRLLVTLALFGLLLGGVILGATTSPALAAGGWHVGETGEIGQGIVCMDADGALEALRMADEQIARHGTMADYFRAILTVDCVPYSGAATFLGRANDVSVRLHDITFVIGRWRLPLGGGLEVFGFIASDKLAPGTGA